MDCPCGEECECGIGCQCGGTQRSIKQWVELVKAREKTLGPLAGLTGACNAASMEESLMQEPETLRSVENSTSYQSIAVVGDVTMRILHCTVQGMSCSSCVSAVEDAALQLPGVKRASVSLLGNRAEVTDRAIDHMMGKYHQRAISPLV